MTLPLPEPRDEEVRDRLARLGIRQAGDPVLRKVARALTLPEEAREGRAVLDHMAAILRAVRKLHAFKNGVGIAAPQVGASLRLALILLPREYPIRLINPRVVSSSARQTTDFEGCLSFFDYRGRVCRPWSVTVETQDLQGRAVTRTFEDFAARLVMHELDHLDGRLYVDLLLNDSDLIDIAEYSGDRRHG
jgi:peptide deformylase